MSKLQTLILFTVIVIISMFYLSTIREGQEWGDFAQYILHSKNIAELKNYKNIKCIFPEYIPYMGPQSTPPAFPLLLAPIYKISNSSSDKSEPYNLFSRDTNLNLTPMKIQVISFFIFSLILIAFIFRNYVEFPTLLAIIALFGFNPYLWDFKEHIVSDFPYLSFSLGTLYLINKTYSQTVGTSRQSPPRRDPDTAGGGTVSLQKIFYTALLLFLSISTRVAGISLFIAFFIYDITRLPFVGQVRNKKPSAFLLKACGLAIVLIIIQKFIIHTNVDYAKEFSFNVRILYQSLFGYARAFVELWHNGYFIIPSILLSTGLLFLAFWGFIHRIRTGITIFEIYVPVYLLGVILWPRVGGIRYLIPIIPFIFFYIFSAAGESAIRRACSGGLGIQKLKRYKILLFSSIIGMVSISYVANYTTLNWGHIDGVTNQGSIELFDFITKNTSPDDIFIFNRPHSLALYTDRRTTLYPYTHNTDSLFWHIKKVDADYIIVGGKHLTICGRLKAFGADQKYLVPLVQSYPDSFSLTYSNQDFKLYKVKK